MIILLSNASSTNKPELSLDERLFLDIGRMVTSHRNLMFGLLGFLAVFAVANALGIAPDDLSLLMLYALMAIMFVSIYTSQKSKNKINETRFDYIARNYFISLETTSPEGKDSLEKIVNLCQSVFPQIKRTIRKNDGIWENTHDKLDGNFKFDVSLKLDLGVKFLVKRFDKTVTFEDVSDVVRIISKYYKGRKEPLRVICLAKDFDESLLAEDFAKKLRAIEPKNDWLNIIFQKPKYWLALDLIQERDNGFSMIWMSQRY